MNLTTITRSSWPRYVVAAGLVFLAAVLRIWPLGALELRIPYVTFYPAAVVASLYGGLFTGLLMTVLSRPAG